MKATLEFTLPEERADHEHAVCGIDYYCALIGFGRVLQDMHEREGMNRYTLEQVRVAFREALLETDVHIDKEM